MNDPKIVEQAYVPMTVFLPTSTESSPLVRRQDCHPNAKGSTPPAPWPMSLRRGSRDNPLGPAQSAAWPPAVVLRSRRTLPCWLAFVLAALAVMGPAAGVAGPARAETDTGSEPLPPVGCLLVDSDANLDDLRALAVVANQRRVVAVVATDGILPAEEGAATLARFLAGAASRGPTVIRGQGRSGSSPPPTFGWLSETRAEAERLDGELSQITPTRLPVLTPASPKELGEAVAHATRDCPTLGVLMIGPWSSFATYYDAIRDRLRFVVSQGQPPDDPVDPGWDGVNCDFDSRSCQRALQELKGLDVRWVNLARGAPFPLDQAMIDRLGSTPLARELRGVMESDPSWRKQQLWDDTAAIFIVRPGAFRRSGYHYEPAISPSEMRSLEVELINDGS